MNWMWNAMVAVAVASPTYLIRFSISGIPFTLFEVLILALVGATAVRWCAIPSARAHYIQKSKVIPAWFVVMVAVFVASATVSVFVAPEIRAALGIWKAYIVEALLFGFVAYLHLEHRAQLQQLAWGLSITAAGVAGYAVVQKFTGWGIPNPFWRAEATRRVTSVFGYPNAVGLYLELALPFFIVMMAQLRQWWARVWFGMVVILSLAAILFAESSGTIAALGAATVFVLLLFKQARWWTVGACVVGALVITLSPYRGAFADEFLLQGFSGGLRRQMWKETVQMLKERPIVGAGLAGYQERVKPFHVNKRVEIYLYPHNLPLTLWSETGLFGAAAFLGILVTVFWWSVQQLRRVARDSRVWAGALAAVWVIIAVHGLVDTPFFKNDFSALFWLLVAITLMLRYNRSSCDQ